MKAIASNGVEISTGDPVLVRNYDENWIYTYFSHKVDNSDWPYVSSCTCSTQCIPYKGNEHLVGTSKDYKSYKEKQEEWIKENNIKIGDKVKITKKSFDGDNGWKAVWLALMDATVTGIGIINNIDKEGINIKTDKGIFWYPYHILEKIKDGFEFKFGAKVKAICENGDIIKGILIKYRSDFINTPYCVAIDKNSYYYSFGTWEWVKSIEYIE